MFSCSVLSLEKDVLLSHIVGGVVFFATVAALGRIAGVPRQISAERPYPSNTVLALAVGEASRFAAFLLYGLVIGGIIGAWRLSTPSLVPALMSVNDITHGTFRPVKNTARMHSSRLLAHCLW